MDIAPLGFYVDTSGLAAGQKAASDFTVTVGKAGEAADRLGQKIKGSGTAASEAATGLSRAGKEAADTAQKTDKLAQSAGTATGAFQQFLQRLQQARKGMVESGEGATGFLGRLGQVNAMMGAAQQSAGSMAQALGVGGAAGGLGGALGSVTGAAGLAGRAMMGLGSALGPVGLVVGTVTTAMAGLSVTVSENQDRWNQYRQRLGVALEDMNAATASVERLSVIADETGTSMDAIMRSFQRFATVRTEIGATVEELEVMTKAIVQLGTLSGTSQGEMQGAMLQFSQALAAGRLNGDELRSIMESMQPLLREIAIGMGVSVGEMRRLGAEGELTSDKIFDALMSRVDEIDAMSQSIDGTSERAQQRMANQWDKMLAGVGEFIEASQTVQSVYGGIADVLATINGLLGDSEKGSEALANRAAMQINLARGAASIPLIGPAVALGLNYAAGDSASSAQEAANREAAAARAPVNEMEALDALTGQIEKKVKSLTTEYAKQFDQLKAMKTVQDDIAKTRADLLKQGEMGRRELDAAKAELDRRDLEIKTLEYRALGGDQQAKDQLDKARERLVTAELALSSVSKSQQMLDLIEREVNERAADIADGGLSKLRAETDRLREAMLQGGGGMVEIYTRAAEMAKKATDENVTAAGIAAALIDQRRAQAGIKIGDMNYSAGLQEQLAGRLFAGDNKTSAEVEVEALTWAFGQFGTALKDNMDVVNAYSAALLRMRAAQQQVADAAELEAINRSIKGTEASIAAVGMGGYAERLAAFEARMQERIAERTGMRQAYAGASTTAITSGAATATGDMDLEGALAIIRRVFPGARITSTNRPGAITSSGNVSDHSVGRAIDFVPAGGMSRYAPGEVKRMLEEAGFPLRTGAGGREQFFGPGLFYAKKWGDHDDHFHAAFRNGASPGAAPGATTQSPFDPSKFDEATRKLIEAERKQFEVQERLRAVQEIANFEKQAADNRERIAVIGSEPEERRVDLQIRINDAVRGLLPDEAQRLEYQIRQAEASKLELEAKRQIAQVNRQNDERERRIGVMGDPAAERRLALELEIARIQRTLPPDQQGAAIAGAQRGFELDTDEATARARVDREARTRSLQEQFTLVQFVGDELAVQEAVMRRQEELRRAGLVVGSEYMAQQLAIEEAFARQEVRLRNQLRQREAIRDAYLDAAQEIGDGFAKMFSYAFREGELKANFALRAIELAFYNMLDRLVQQLVVSPLVDMLGRIFNMAMGSFTGGGGLSSGGAIPNNYGQGFDATLALGGVVPAAAGMVVNTPTRVKGGKYLTGEGPGLYEAILPLRRGPDGKLGVSAPGGGSAGSGSTTVVINDMRSSRDSEAVTIEERETGDGMREVNVMIRDAVRTNMRLGAFDSDNRAIYGITRAVTRR